MCHLIESIRIENKKPQLLEYHNRRFNAACKMLYNLEGKFDLNHYIQLPPDISGERYKYRILFDGKKFKTEIHPYTQKRISTLRLVRMDDIEYPFKTTNRDKLDAAFSMRGHCDDVIILKNGWITDAYFSNILLFNGRDWVTPANPLLKGTQRAFLLDKEQVVEKDVSENEIQQYTHIKLVNAMVPFDRADLINVRNDVWGI